MTGKIILSEELHKKVVRIIVNQLVGKINNKRARFILTLAGESGSGKSETARAIAEELGKCGIQTIVLGQDDYCYLAPKFNDLKRKADPDWLGPHLEVNMDLLENNLKAAVNGADEITKPHIDAVENTIIDTKISLRGIKVVIAEGTYTSLLKNADIRIFIDRTWLDTLESRKKRNRRDEVNDPFTEQILVTEHKIIAGHKHLADFIITDNLEVIIPE